MLDRLPTLLLDLRLRDTELAILLPNSKHVMRLPSPKVTPGQLLRQLDLVLPVPMPQLFLLVKPCQRLQWG